MLLRVPRRDEERVSGALGSLAVARGSVRRADIAGDGGEQGRDEERRAGGGPKTGRAGGCSSLRVAAGEGEEGVTPDDAV